ncbi:MAG TPA: DUF302 domain-containing protein [Acidimicrobiales bacterium]|nr:DUF302 domain-containing protein [Acidimicrobiales bacterium]
MIFEEAMVMSGPFDEVLQRVKDAFAAEGFGTLTEIDIQATLAAKVGKEMGRYVIVGACNPHLASRALDVEPQIGVLLPCNVVVREAAAGVMVEAMDPGLMASVTGSAAVTPIAAEARQLVNQALARLAAP